MFKELLPILRHRAVLFTVTHLENDELRVNVIPQKVKDGDNDALTTPLSLTGLAEELDANLPATLIGYVGSHLQLTNTLTKAQAEMDAAAKAMQAEARSKSKGATKPGKPVDKAAAATQEIKEAAPAAPPKGPSLFDSMTDAGETGDDEDEEAAIMDEIAGEPA